MKGIDRRLLESLPELPRRPELLALLARTTGELDAPEAARALLLDIAVPRKTEDALSMLLAAGEFGAAERVLEAAKLREEISEEEHHKFNDDVELARRRAREALHLRAATLQARAQRARSVSPRPGALDDASEKRRALGESLLDDWEVEVRQAEQRLGDDLRRSMAAVPLDDVAGAEAWRNAVEGCIRSQEYDAARYLIQAGPVAPVPNEPQAVARRLEWPWKEPVSEILAWATGSRQAPREFDSAWRCPPNDAFALQLVQILRRIVTAGEVTRETAADFVNCFDTFLGCDDHIANVTDVSEGFEVRTRALDDIRLPVLREHGRNGVSIILARSEASTPETGVGAVLFQPWGLSVTSE